MVAPDHDAPTVFVAYTHDSPRHKADVLALAELLVANGVRTELDQWAEGRRQDWHTWALRHITASDYTIIIASPQCKVVGDGGSSSEGNRGATAELAVLRDLLQEDRATWLPKLLPVVLPGRDVVEIPLFLQPRAADHYRVDLTPEGIEGLLRTIYEEPRVVRPALGPRPVFSRQDAPAPATEPSWRVLPDEVEVQWRSDIERLTRSWLGQQFATLEVHLVPASGGRVSMSHLRAVEQRLPSYAVEKGLVDLAAGVDTASTEDVVRAWSRDTSRAGEGGLAFLRTGQRSAWTVLRRGRIGTVLIRDDVVSGIQLMLSALAELSSSLPEQVVPVAGISPADLVRRGDHVDLTSTTASLPMSGTSDVRLRADEAVSASDLVAMTGQVAVELAERLLARFPEPDRRGW